MSLKTSIIDPEDGTSLELERYWQGHHPISKDERFLSVTTPTSAHSTFRSLERSTAGTDIIVAPNDNGSLVLSDIIVTTEKQTAGTVTVQYNDGTNSELIFKAFAKDGPISISTALTGRVQGWRDAWIEWVNVGDTDSTILLTYVKVPEGLPYAEWDAFR
jgi:hypothetical protein